MVTLSDFPGVVAYFFNNIVQEYEIVYKDGLSLDINLDNIISTYNLDKGPVELDNSRISNVDSQKKVLCLPLMSCYGLVGSIFFFKEKEFTDNEKIFLKMILTQTNSFLEVLFFRKATRDQEKLKRNPFRF